MCERNFGTHYYSKEKTLNSNSNRAPLNVLILSIGDLITAMDVPTNHTQLNDLIANIKKGCKRVFYIPYFHMVGRAAKIK